MGWPVLWKQCLLVGITLSTILTSENIGIVLPFITPPEAQDKQLGLGSGTGLHWNFRDSGRAVHGGQGEVITFNSSQLAHSSPRVSSQVTSFPVWWPSLHIPDLHKHASIFALQVMDQINPCLVWDCAWTCLSCQYLYLPRTSNSKNLRG